MEMLLHSLLLLLTLTSSALLLPGCQAESDELGDSNWLERLSSGQNDTWLLKFFAPWCPACRRLEPAWRLLAQRAGEVDGLRIGHVDVAKEEVLGGMFLITQLPTVYLYTPDGSFRQFEFSSISSGSSDDQLAAAWLSFARPSGGHSGIAALPWYRSPMSPHVRCIAWLIRGALSVRNLHTRLTGPQIGMSVHLAYLVIICLAVSVGAGVVLCLVCLCDRLCPEYTEDSDEPAAAAPADEVSQAKEGPRSAASAAAGDSEGGDSSSGGTVRRRPVAASAAGSADEEGVKTADGDS